ncbi:MAG TPA: hypothetical protein VHY31_06855 [Streptosporangiaceae bacterium]|jgi:hypothetical protein|nr:hypothetical protein [Streptosporangiaceae bacterium]
MNRKLRTAVEIIAGASVAFALTAAVASVSNRPAFLSDGWSNPSVRPTVLYTGNGSAPWIGHLAWSSWSSASATGTGVLTRSSPHCRAAHPMDCAVQRLKATVTLKRPEVHGKQAYYSRMTWVFVNRSRHRITQVWKYAELPGGTVPAWNLIDYPAPGASAAPAPAAA